MAGEVAVEGAAAAAAEVADSNQQSHKLERKWTFWFDNQSRPKQGAAWGTSLRKVYTFDTVEEFWWYVLRSPSPPMFEFRGFLYLFCCANLCFGRLGHGSFDVNFLLLYFSCREIGISRELVHSYMRI